MQLVFEIFRSTEAGDPYAFRTGVQEYVVRTAGGGASSASFDWDQALLDDLAALRRRGGDGELRQRLGERLRRFMAPTGFAELAAQLQVAADRAEPIALTLRLAAAELFALPWELLTLKASGQHLGELPTLLIRYAWPESQTAAEPTAAAAVGPGRIFVAYATAGGAVPAAEHIEAIERACQLGQVPFVVSRDVLPAASASALAAGLHAATAAGEPVALLHLLCHGAPLSAGGFGLALHSAAVAGDSDVVDAARLRQLLGPHAATLRLVVLCACDGANPGPLGAQLGSVAQALHRSGIAAVVASRAPLSTAGSVRLAESLYAALLGPPASLETAFRHTRRALLESAAAEQGLDWANLQLLARPEDGDDSRPLLLRPYRGLEAFDSRHSRFFFGREAECAQALAALQALIERQKPRLLIVSGASGTGKSSVVLAGVLPTLCAQQPAAGPSLVPSLEESVGQLQRLLGERAQRQPLAEALKTVAAEVASLSREAGSGWEAVVLRPGQQPLLALDAALAARQKPDRPLLLVVDQFEELFTQTDSPAQRQEFAARLWQLSQGDSGISCLLTLRVDFLGHCGELVLDSSGLRLDRLAYAEGHRVFVAQLLPSGLRAAIEGPAQRVGLTLSDGLAAQMVADVQGEPGALPLLEYVLDLLWQRRQGRLLLAQSYSELGGVSGALSASADRLFAGLSDEQKPLARRLLVALVNLGEDGHAVTRRRATLPELAQRALTTASALEPVLTLFVAARLLVRSEDGGQAVVEVAHESLLRKWPRLRNWISEDRQRLSELQEIERWVTTWDQYKTLLSGAQLGYATQVLGKYGDDLGPKVAQLVSRSRRAERRRFWSRITVPLLVFFALSTLYGRARSNLQRAELATRVATSRLLANQAAQQLDSQLDLSLLLAARAFQLQPEPSSTSVLAAALTRSHGLRSMLWGPRGKVRSVAFSPVGQRLFAIGEEPIIYQYEVGAGGWQLTRRLPVSPALSLAALAALAVSRDGQLLAVGGSGGAVGLYDIASGRLHGPPLPAAPSAVKSLEFTVDGSLLAAGADDGTVRLWQVASGQAAGSLRAAEPQPLRALSSARDAAGRLLLAAASDAGSVQLWELGAQRWLGERRGSGWQLASAVGFSADGSRLLAAGQSGPLGGATQETVLVWPVAGNESPVGELRGAAAGLAGLSLVGRDQLLVGCGGDAKVRLWELASGQPVGSELAIGEAPISSCGQSPDGELLAVGTVDRVLLWQLDQHEALHRLDDRYRLAVSGLASSPDGATLAIGGADGSLRLWSVAQQQQLGPAVALHQGPSLAVAFSPDGQTVASAGSDGEVALLEVASQAPLGRLPRPGSAVGRALVTVAYSPKGDLLAAGGGDGVVARWQLPSRRPLPTVRPDDQRAVTALAFRPDGAILASGSSRGSIALLAAPTGMPLCPPLRGHLDTITSLSFSPDGQTLASGSRDGTLRLWTLAGCGAQLGEPLDGGSGAVVAVAFRRDGQLIASGYSSGSMVLWNVLDRRRQGPPWRPSRTPLSGLAFAPGGLLFSGDAQALWSWPTVPEVAVACRRANRNLSLREWQQHFGDAAYCRICKDPSAGEGAPNDAATCAE